LEERGFGFLEAVLVPKILRARPAADAAEEKTVRKLAAARHAPADWILRGRMVALSWAGLRVPAIAKELGCHEQTVRRWLVRFNASGLDGLADLGGQGRKRRISEAERSRIVALVKQPPPGRPVRREDGELAAAEDESGAPFWTLDALTEAARAEGMDIHRSQVRRILLSEGVRWRRTRSWIRSKDPDFVPKGRGSSGSTRTRPRT
jgi:transposase